jgi:hypothetical protein
MVYVKFYEIETMLCLGYRAADKSLARPDWKKQLKFLYFSSNAEVIADAETWLDGQISEFFLSGLQKLEFGRCSLFPSRSGSGLISTPVVKWGCLFPFYGPKKICV